MNTTVRNVFLIIVILTFILLPLMAGIIGLFIETDEDDHSGNMDFSMICSFPMECIRSMSAQQMAAVLWFGMSIFALFVVYLGGRSKAKRFNDRTIEPNKSLIVAFSKAALFIRAAFNFCILAPNRVSQTANCLGFLYTHDSIFQGGNKS